MVLCLIHLRVHRVLTTHQELVDHLFCHYLLDGEFALVPCLAFENVLVSDIVDLHALPGPVEVLSEVSDALEEVVRVLEVPDGFVRDDEFGVFV